ncbi:protein of unknown function [Ralstonia solanacearum CMR15]|nr:protein of unknown function [Ralstonia solanacearum CMR15]
MYAIYTDAGILAVAPTVEAAIERARCEHGLKAALVAQNTSCIYHGGIVDLTTAWRISADSERAGDSETKLRRCSARLAAAVEAGRLPVFAVMAHGELDLIEDA